MDDLTLPIPEAIRVCSPVVHPDHGRFVVVALHPGSGMGDITIQSLEDAGMPCPVGFSTVALDLTDATGRAHASWWLVRRLGEGPMPMASGWNVGRHNWRHVYGWAIGTVDWNRGEAHHWWWQDECDFLADLDPNDPRTLADGSRWVDAEALRLVCLHVAGVDR